MNMNMSMQTQTLIINDEPHMAQLAAAIAKGLCPGVKIYLSGQLGAGKTTLIRFILKSLEIKDNIKSPTYTLVEPYKIDNQQYYHFDFYRIHSPEELFTIGIEDYLTEDAICFIEWPEHAKEILPPPDLQVNISIRGQGRKLMMYAASQQGKNILEKINQEIKND